MPGATDPEPSPASCCAVVVTYHPDDGFPERIARLSSQVARTYVVDNASNDAARRMLGELARRDVRVVLVLMDANEGIAAALNHGCDRALADGFAWAVTCDQDSVVEPDLVAELASIRAEHPRRADVKIVAPNYVMGTGGEGIRLPPGNARWHEIATAITSGALTSLEAYRAVGPFRADYFIDSVDEEFCLRLRRRGWSVVCSRRPLMRHALGSARYHRVLGLDVPRTHHAAFRRYYIARNRVLTLRQYGWREPRWALAVTRELVFDLVTVPLLESDKLAKVRAMLLGLWHGMLGRTGKLDRAF